MTKIYWTDKGYGVGILGKKGYDVQMHLENINDDHNQTVHGWIVSEIVVGPLITKLTDKDFFSVKL